MRKRTGRDEVQEENKKTEKEGREGQEGEGKAEDDRRGHNGLSLQEARKSFGLGHSFTDFMK